MSYNCTDWATRELVDFTIKLSDLQDNLDGYDDIEEEVLDQATNSYRYEFYESYVEGVLNADGDTIHVSAICIDGEGSNGLNTIFEESIFPNSTGTLKARRVWGGGDSIDKIKVINGSVVLLGEDDSF